MKVVVLAALLGCRALHAADPNGPQISGPYTHDNLSVFLIHGASAKPTKHYVTLKDAMEAKQVIVHETKMSTTSRLRMSPVTPFLSREAILSKAASRIEL